MKNMRHGIKSSFKNGKNSGMHYLHYFKVTEYNLKHYGMLCKMESISTIISSDYPHSAWDLDALGD